MKHWFGGLLSIALGVVLIVSGGVGTNSATGGAVLPTCQFVADGIAVPCPTGTITVSEQTRQAAAAFARVPALAPTPPANWLVTITSSNCTAPDGSAVNQTLSVPNGGHADSIDLFLFTDPSHGSTCKYDLVETPVAGFTAAFDPASPVEIPFDQSRQGSHLAVALTNTFAAPSATSTPVPPSSPVASSVAPPSSSAEPTSTGAGSGSASGSAAALASTGPRSSVSVTLLAGIALCLLGLVLLVAGHRTSRASRRRG